MSTNTLTTPIVSVGWVFKHLKDPQLVILDGSIKKVDHPASDVSEVQIPKARFFDLKAAFSDTTARFPTTFPSEEQFTREAQRLGINRDSVLVVYDEQGIYSSARVWWLFKAMGHEQVAVLDGGLPAWIQAGHHTETRMGNPLPEGDFVARYQPALMVFFEDVQKASENKSHVIVDARSEARFQSLEPEPRAGLRMGTIPHSVNLPYTDLLQENKLLPTQDIAAKFQKLAKKEEALIFSCGSGITACILALGASMSGYEQIAVYDGSWTEWGSLVTETP